MGRVRIDPSSRMPFEPAAQSTILERSAPVVRPSVRGPEGREALSAPFVELFARSNFSFLAGASAPAALVARANQLGYDALGLTDLDGFYGAVRALEESERQRAEAPPGTRLVLGCELTLDAEANAWEAANAGVVDSESPLAPSFAPPLAPPLANDAEPRVLFASVILHVETHVGYEGACRLLSESHARHPKGRGRSDAERTEPFDPDPRARNTFAGVPLSSVLALPSGLWATLRPSRALVLAAAKDSAVLERARHDVLRLKEAFGERASLLLTRHLDGEDRARFQLIKELSRATGVPIVVSNAPLFATPEDRPLYDVISCIREGQTLDEAGRALLPNAEACLKSPGDMVRLFADLPEAVARTRVIADACQFSLRELRYRFPCEIDEPAFEGETPDEALRRVAYAGVARRYGEKPPKAILVQIERELVLIGKLGVAPYFLSVHAIVEMARSRDILCQGRGSAANSAVCFVLGITAVDPSRSNLLFERFLSIERSEPPDIDVDFEHERREEVIQAIYAKYGRERAAMVSEVITYRGKSALREVGKVFGLSLEQVDRLSSLVSWWDGVSAIEPARLVSAGFDPNDGRIELVLRFAAALQGTPRHLSIHVGGFVLSAEPLARVAPVEPATMPGRTIIPWDKDDLDTLGFFKVDVLGLGMLTAIRKALAFAAQDDPRVRAESAIDALAKIPPEDPAVYDALCKADTVGVFQIESRAQMAMLPRLLPRVFYDIVVEVAIVRPGPIQGGMVHPYLRRRNAEEPAVAPHPILAPILDRTLGVPLFQEQVMQIAIVGAGYTGGEADQLRRDMAAWKKTGRLERHRERLLEGFQKRGISREFGERLYAQIQGFGEYGFPESHAASFALLVYASSWLKAHHPAAFAAALVNSQPMGFYSPNTILKDAQRHGVTLRPIDVLESGWDCSLEAEHATAAATPAKSPAIRVGLRQVKGLGEEAGRRVEAFVRHARLAHLPIEVASVAHGAKVTRKELEALAEAGAFDALGSSLMKGRAATGSPTNDAREGGNDDAVLEKRTPSRASRAKGVRGDDPRTRPESRAAMSGGAARREALWAARAPRAREGELFEGMSPSSATPVLPPLSRAEQLSLDYERTGLSVNDHPMQLLRSELSPRFADSLALTKARHGSAISVAGLVICRQRPATASGVVFITMEDEHGFLNLILYARVFDEQRHVATTAHLLAAHGTVEREGEVVYVVVKTLEPIERLAHQPDGRTMPSMSRDFH